MYLPQCHRVYFSLQLYKATVVESIKQKIKVIANEFFTSCIPISEVESLAQLCFTSGIPISEVKSLNQMSYFY
jgi:hypothetical protein